MQLKFTKDTDTKHEVSLDSSIVSAAWRCGRALAGREAALEVYTAFVGEAAPLTIKLHSERNGQIGNAKGKIHRNRYLGRIAIPEDCALGDKVYFVAELKKHGLSLESDHIPVYPPPEISNQKWSAEEARRGDVLTLSADVRNLPEQAEVKLVIYEYDEDGHHDRIIELPGRVSGNKIEVRWEYEYHEDTDEIPTEEEMERYGRSYNPPEYFFTVKVEDTEFGCEQESGLLRFKDWIEIELAAEDGTPIAGEKYEVTLPDGSKKEGTLDDEGMARVDGIPPGPCTITFPDLEQSGTQGTA